MRAMMNHLKRWLRRIRLLTRRQRFERDMDAEMRLHVEMEAEDLVRRGLSPGEARRRAMLTFGGLDRFKEEARESRGLGGLDLLLQDTRYAFRTLRRNRGSTFVSLLTLALGIGGTVAVWVIVRSVLLAPLPYPEPDRLVRLFTNFPSADLTELSLSPGEFVDVAERSTAFDTLAGFIPSSFTLMEGSGPERVEGAWVTPGFFTTLGIRPADGRGFSAEDGEPGASRAAVLSHRLWTSRFGGDADVVGTPLRINGEAFDVVGVAPPGFEYPGSAEIWTALRLTPGLLSPGERGSRFLRVVGRLRAGATPERAARDLNGLTPGFREEHPEFYSGSDFALSIVPLHERLVGDIRPALLVLLAAVVFLLAIACANVASLFIARTMGRRREMAVRRTLGASTSRLLRHFLVESLVLSSAATAMGLLLAAWIIRSLPAFAPASLPRLDEVAIGGSAVALAVGLALALGTALGLFAAIHSRRSQPADALRSSGRGTTADGSQTRVRSGLVTLQLALSMTLVIGAGLLMRSFVELRSVDPGLDPSGVMTARVTLPASTYDSPERVAGFYRELLGRAAALPGAESVAAAAILPLTDGGWDVSLEIPERPSSTGAPERNTQYRPVTAAYFRTLRIPLLRGRTFVEDGPDTPLVAVVNEAFARRHFPGELPIGRRVELPLLGVPMDRHIREIVGVVADVRDSIEEDARPTLYVPHAQQPERSLALLIRTAAEPHSVTAPLRSIVAELDATLPIYEVRSMEHIRAAAIAQDRFNLAILGSFSALALLLALVGLYGVTSYTVSARTREIGVRVALGATPRRVLARALRSGAFLVLSGAILGLLGAIAATRLIGRLLFEVSPTDPGTYTVTTILMIATGLAACYLPARRASRVDPVRALRAD